MNQWWDSSVVIVKSIFLWHFVLFPLLLPVNSLIPVFFVGQRLKSQCQVHVNHTFLTPDETQLLCLNYIPLKPLESIKIVRPEVKIVQQSLCFPFVFKRFLPCFPGFWSRQGNVWSPAVRIWRCCYAPLPWPPGTWRRATQRWCGPWRCFHQCRGTAAAGGVMKPWVGIWVNGGS